MRKAPGKRVEGLVSQVHFVPRIILGCNLMPLMLNICVQFIRLCILVGYQNTAIEPNLVNVFRI